MFFRNSFGSTGLMIFSITASTNSCFICLPSLISGACCVESTTVSIADGLPSTYSQRDLALGVGAQVRHAAVLAQLRLALDQAVRVVDRRRHQLGRLVAGVAEHQALVAGALLRRSSCAWSTPCAMSGICLS